MSNKTRVCKLCGRKKCGKKDRCKEKVEFMHNGEGYEGIKGTRLQRIMDVRYRLKKLDVEIKESRKRINEILVSPKPV